MEKEAQLVEDNSSLKDQLEELASMQDTMIEDLATCRAEQLKGAAEIETLQGLVQTYEEAAVQKSSTIASLEEDLAKSCSDLEEVDCKLKDTINKNTEEVKTTDDALAALQLRHAEEMASLQQELATSQEDLCELESQLEALAAEEEERMKESKDAMIVSLQQELAFCRAKIAELEAQNMRFVFLNDEEEAKQQKVLHDFESLVAAHEKTIEGLQRDLASSQTELAQQVLSSALLPPAVSDGLTSGGTPSPRGPPGGTSSPRGPRRSPTLEPKSPRRKSWKKPPESETSTQKDTMAGDGGASDSPTQEAGQTPQQVRATKEALQAEWAQIEQEVIALEEQSVLLELTGKDISPLTQDEDREKHQALAKELEALQRQLKKLESSQSEEEIQLQERWQELDDLTDSHVQQVTRSKRKKKRKEAIVVLDTDLVDETDRLLSKIEAEQEAQTIDNLDKYRRETTEVEKQILMLRLRKDERIKEITEKCELLDVALNKSAEQVRSNSIHRKKRKEGYSRGAPGDRQAEDKSPTQCQQQQVTALRKKQASIELAILRLNEQELR